MSGVDRREFAKTAALAAVVVAASSTANAAETPPAAVKPSGPYQPKPMAFEPTKVKGISEKLLTSHYENN
jgi:Fe-Mn family superoxide dismutase